MEGNNNPQSMPSEPGPGGSPYPAPGTIPRATININDALEAAKESDQQPSGTVRTFQSDIAHSVKNDNVSMIKIALAEKARQEQSPQYADVSRHRKHHGGLVAILIALLLIGGAVAAWYFYINKPLPPTIAEQIAPNEPELLYSEEEAVVSSYNKSSEQIIRELRTEILEDLDLGVIKRTLLSSGTATTTRNTAVAEFLTLIRSRTSDSLKAAFETQYFLGGYSNNPHDTFILIKVNSYESAYPGMLAWEPYMESDIGRFFPSSLIATTTPPTAIQPSVTSTLATSTGTSTEETSISTTSLPSAAPAPIRTVNQAGAAFEDRIIQNKDTRALVGLDGKIKFLYTFLDPKTLLIVSSERGLKEVQARLTTGRIRR